MDDFKNFVLSVKDLQMIDFKKVFNLNYLIDNTLPLDAPLVAALGYFFVVVLLIGIIARIILVKKNKKLPIYSTLIGHITNLSLWLPIIGLIFVFGRFQAIPMISNRMLMLINLLFLFAWAAWIMHYTIVKLPQITAIYQNKQLKSKYLPKPKKKSK